MLLLLLLLWGIKFVSPLTTRTSVFSSSPTRRPWCSNSQGIAHEGSHCSEPCEFTSRAFLSESLSNYSRRPRRERNWGGRRSRIRKLHLSPPPTHTVQPVACTNETSAQQTFPLVAYCFIVQTLTQDIGVNVFQNGGRQGGSSCFLVNSLR